VPTLLLQCAASPAVVAPLEELELGEACTARFLHHRILGIGIEMASNS
jgi:hypothetical protein